MGRGKRVLPLLSPRNWLSFLCSWGQSLNFPVLPSCLDLWDLMLPEDPAGFCLILQPCNGSSTLLLWEYVCTGPRHQFRFCVPGKQFFHGAENFVWTSVKWKCLNSAGTGRLEALFSTDEWIFVILVAVLLFSVFWRVRIPIREAQLVCWGLWLVLC